MMQNRLLMIALLLLAVAARLPAQEEQPPPEGDDVTEEPDSQDPAAVLPATDGEAPVEPAQTAPVTGTGEPGLDSFKPSEEISADRSVAFPNDI